MSEPIAKIRDFGVSAAIFEWERDGKKSYSISLQRSYKKKDASEYTNETINMYPEDLLKFANVLTQAYNKYVDIRNGSHTPVSTPAPQSPIIADDDVPF